MAEVRPEMTMSFPEPIKRAAPVEPVAPKPAIINSTVEVIVSNADPDTSKFKVAELPSKENVSTDEAKPSKLENSPNESGPLPVVSKLISIPDRSIENPTSGPIENE